MPARRDEPGGLELIEGEATLLRLLGEPSSGRQAKPELLRDLLSEAAPAEVLPHRCARVAVPEEALEVPRSLVEHRVEALAPPTLRLDAR